MRTLGVWDILQEKLSVFVATWGLISPANSLNGNFSRSFFLEIYSDFVSFQQMK